MSYFQLNDYTALRITGENVNEFLPGQISSNIYESKHFKTLFCDEKGYVITNANIILDKDALIIVKTDIAKILNDNLSKFSKFFKCRIQQEDIDVYGRIIMEV
jgi:Aminomethyltransferase folate-binding domain.